MEAQYEEMKATGGTDGGQLTLEDAMAQLQRSRIVKPMDPTNFASGEYTSLRKHWRKRLNPRKEATYRIGESGPHPSEKHSRWRMFPFTAMDVQNSRMLRWGTFDIGGTDGTQKGHRVTVRMVQYFSTNIASPQASSAGSTEPTPQSMTYVEGTGAPTIGGGAITSSPSIASSAAVVRSRRHMQDAAVSFCLNIFCFDTSYTPARYCAPVVFLHSVDENDH